MKKLFFTLAVLIAANFSANAQCTPDASFTGPGMKPDTLSNLDTAFKQTYYEEVITFIVPVDTTVSNFSASIDSMVISAIQGLPSSLSYTCDMSRCMTPGGQKGCVKIYGTPTSNDVGDHTLVIKANLSGKLLMQPMTLPYDIKGYHLYVKDQVGIDDRAARGFELMNNMPNPFRGETTIVFVSDKSETYAFSVYDNTGKQIFSENINAKTGENQYVFNAKSLKSGIYLYSLKNDRGIVSNTMIVE